MEETSQRTPQKILLLAIVISLAGHLVMLLVTGLMIPEGRGERPSVLTVELQDRTEPPENEPQEKQEAKPAPPPAEEKAKARELPEDTVDLGDRDSKYIPYLKKLRQKIMAIWGYPRQAYERKEEGDVVVKFSLNRNGGLEQALVLTSSGSGFLDLGALEVIDAAAPYDPFPREVNLSRLHIIATFKYRMER